MADDQALEEAIDGMLHIILQRLGYDSLDAIREEGRALGVEKGIDMGVEMGRTEALANGILAVLQARGLVVEPDVRMHVSACSDLQILERDLVRAVTVRQARELLRD
ncbi:MAG: hypothetical protein WCI05_04760 [Myxococcales bacterium]